MTSRSLRKLQQHDGPPDLLSGGAYDNRPSAENTSSQWFCHSLNGSTRTYAASAFAGELVSRHRPDGDVTPVSRTRSEVVGRLPSHGFSDRHPSCAAALEGVHRPSNAHASAPTHASGLDHACAWSSLLADRSGAYSPPCGRARNRAVPHDHDPTKMPMAAHLQFHAVSACGDSHVPHVIPLVHCGFVAVASASPFVRSSRVGYCGLAPNLATGSDTRPLLPRAYASKVGARAVRVVSSGVRASCRRHWNPSRGRRRLRRPQELAEFNRPTCGRFSRWSAPLFRSRTASGCRPSPAPLPAPSNTGCRAGISRGAPKPSPSCGRYASNSTSTRQRWSNSVSIFDDVRRAG